MCLLSVSPLLPSSIGSYRIVDQSIQQRQFRKPIPILHTHHSQTPQIIPHHPTPPIQSRVTKRMNQPLIFQPNTFIHSPPLLIHPFVSILNRNKFMRPSRISSRSQR